jgi:signal transduction histidine kinase
VKLRPRIALASCLAALVSVGVTGALLIAESRSYSAQQLSQRHLLLVQNRAYALGDSLEIASRELVRLSQMAEVDLTDNDLRPEATLLAHAHRNSTLFNIGLEIEDATGRCLWSEPASDQCAGHSFTDAPWFVSGRAARAPVVMAERAPDRATIINLVVPIGGTPGAAAGVLRGIIDVRSDRIISPAITAALPSGTEAALVSRDGSVIFPAGLSRTPGWDEAIAAAAHAARTFVIDEGGVRWLYAYAPVVHADWGLVFRWRYSTLDTALSRQVRLLLRILTLGGALAILLGLLSSGYLTRPLAALVQAVRTLGSSEAPATDLREAQVAQRSDELGELARAFGDLRARLSERDARHRDDLERIRELATSLEERVRARTIQLEAAQRSLLAQERLAAMGQAAAAISHELKNSLGALGMGVDVIAGEAERSASLRRVHAQVRAEVARLRTMTDELLVFARSPRVSKRPSDLNAIARTAQALCAEQAAMSGIELRLELGGEGAPLVVPCDPERLQSVLVNLIKNGIEAVAWRADGAQPARSEVVISTVPPRPEDPDFATIAVEDSGPGIAPDVREHLFEPFFTTKRNGTGLGLATAQRFVAAHGGRIEVTHPARSGARFEVVLPADEPVAAAVEATG